MRAKQGVINSTVLFMVATFVIVDLIILLLMWFRG